MLIIEAKPGGGKRTPYQGDGLFDFGKILLKKALNSNLVKTASKAINSELGQTAIRAVKKAAQSEIVRNFKDELYQRLKKRRRTCPTRLLIELTFPSL